MKKTIQFLLLSLSIMGAIFFSSCQTSSESTHKEVWSADGKDSVVNVQYVDNNGQSSNFFMNYLLFRSLYNSGGYPNVYHYYQSNPSQFASTSNYTSYKPRTSSSSEYSSGSSSYSSPSRSYSSGSSSSSSSSYSSPSRSYSSPSRSYSSPSRR